jgi:HTH-type transcriptional regulator/antitoxin HigA
VIIISNDIDIRNLPDYPVAPGETLKDTLETLGMTQTELARRMDRPIKTINEIIHAKAAITADTALQLERVLGVTSKFWMNLEANYQMVKAKAEAAKKLAQEIKYVDMFPYAQMAKLGWVKNTRDTTERASELLNFFGIVTFSNMQMVKSVSYRKDIHKKTSPESLTAWARRGELLARDVKTDKYDKQSFLKSLEEIKSLTVTMGDGFDSKLQNICARSGVAVVFVPHLKKTYVNGATRWLTPAKALIQLSIRYRYQDSFWFTFFHEAAHILLHGKTDSFVDVDDQAKSAKEREADQWASDFLIDSRSYIDFTDNNIITISSIREFANRQDVGIGIVIGRLLHDNLITYSKWNRLRSKLFWSEELSE